MLFAVGETVFAMGEMVLAAVGTVFAVDGQDIDIGIANPPPASPPPSLRFRCIWVKRLLQAGVALYTRTV